MCLSMAILPLFSRTGKDHWHLTLESGSPVTQNNWDITLSTGGRFWSVASTGRNWTYHQFVVPYWSLAVVFGALSACWLRCLVRRTRLRAAGLCRICGYDLRATPNRCPECGNVPER